MTLGVGTFAVSVFHLCQAFGGSVTSWIRTAKRNAAVGGVATSCHLDGLGADVVWDNPVPLEAVTKAARDLGLRLIRESDHDHFQPL